MQPHVVRTRRNQLKKQEFGGGSNECSFFLLCFFSFYFLISSDIGIQADLLERITSGCLLNVQP